MWTCPVCSRNFKNKNQDHSCETVDIESHFINKGKNVKAVVDKLMKEVSEIGEFSVSSMKSAILLGLNSQFLAMKPKKNWLDIEFILPEAIDEFPVHKTVQVSKTKWAHFVRLESVDEVDELLLQWLKSAYKVANL